MRRRRTDRRTDRPPTASTPGKRRAGGLSSAAAVSRIRISGRIFIRIYFHNRCIARILYNIIIFILLSVATHCFSVFFFRLFYLTGPGEIKTIDSYARRCDVLYCNIINYYLFFLHPSRTIRVRRSNVNLYNYRYLCFSTILLLLLLYYIARPIEFINANAYAIDLEIVGIHGTTSVIILHAS
jgi:hypothetical protein